MIPQQFLDEQGHIIASLLLSRIGLAVLYILIAMMAAFILPRFVRRSVLASMELQLGGELTKRRTRTIGRLVTYLTRTVIIVVSVLAVLQLFIDSTGLFTFLGLFTAAIGFSIRNIVGDYISGFIFLFEDQFAIGEEVEVGGQRGIVTDVTPRTTTLQAESGDTYIVPNGDIRVVHNYSRGDFGFARVEIQVKTGQLASAVAALQQAAPRLHDRIPLLLERPHVAVEEGVLGATTLVAIQARTQRDQDEAARLRMIEMVRKSLTERGIDLNDASE